MKGNLHRLIDKTNIEYAARKIHLLANFDRTEIVELILKNKVMNVTQIQTQLNYRQADTSQHLLIMHDYGFLKREKRGQMVFYSVDKKAIEEIIKISDDLYHSE
jgi:predicted transcriptional regulator